MRPQHKVIIDWFSMTSRTYGVSDFIELLGLEKASWIDTKGARGYKNRKYWNFISIHFDGNGDTVWLEMSGQGCRAFESFGNGDYKKLFDLAESDQKNFHITRLDVAFDDLVEPDQPGEVCSGILDINTICDDTRKGNYISRSTEWQVVESSKGCSVGIGSMQSDVYIRIYDKARERGRTDGTHWVRVELQLRDDRAFEFTKLNDSIGACFIGVLLNYLRYVIPNSDDENRSRWSMTDYWLDLVNSAYPISIYVKPGVEYNLFRCENYVYNQAGNAISALIELNGIDKFLADLKNRSSKPNPKYDELVKNCRLQAVEYKNKLIEHEVDRVRDILDDIAPLQVNRKKYNDIIQN